MMARPCVGRHRLFDSTALTDHQEAAALCATCSDLDWCRDRLAEAIEAGKAGGTPQGTWAGQLVGAPSEEERAHRLAIKKRSREKNARR